MVARATSFLSHPSAIAVVVVAAFVAAAGCENPPLGELLDGKACSADGACAAGYVCNPSTNVCVPEGTAFGGGGSGAGTTATSSTGEGGSGGCVSVTECPPPQGDCEVPVCIGGLCGTTGLPMGTVAPVQTAGDCKSRICDGLGGVVEQNEDADVPTDGEECTIDMCTSGLPDNPPHVLGTPCTMGDGSFCDGLGLCVECNARSDCTDLPPDDECQQRACVAGQCVMEPTPANTEIALQTAGDCKVSVCNGAGGVMTIAAAADVPNDANECTDDVCTGDQPSNPFVMAGTGCMAGSCNASGQCVGCSSPEDCGTSTFCAQHTCTQGVCGLTYPASGTALPLALQTGGDCAELRCNGIGGTQSVASNSDVPPDDGNECTGEACVGGSPQHPSRPLDTVCSTAGVVCDGAGACVECNNPSQCANQGSVCQTASCGNDHLCGLVDLPQGSAAPPSAQTDGDCRIVVCDGAGTTEEVADDADLPSDGDDCTLDECNGGVSSHPPAPSGAPCGNGGVCNGAGSCSALKPNGDACGDGGECVSGECADGVCCNEACGGTCRSCLAARTGAPDGVCGDISAGQDPELECAAANETCDGAGACAFACGQVPVPPPSACPAACTGGCAGGKCLIDCNGAGSCDGVTITCPAGLACEVQCAGNASCAGSTIDCPDYYACDVVCHKGCNNADIQCGSGACSLYCGSSGNPCGNTELHCGANSCEATCAGTSFPTLVDPSSACSAQACALPNGAACTTGAQCASGHCPMQDGVCCASVCGGLCQSCASAQTGQTSGMCAPVLAGTDPQMECPGANTCSGGGTCQ